MIFYEISKKKGIRKPVTSPDFLTTSNQNYHRIAHMLGKVTNNEFIFG